MFVLKKWFDSPSKALNTLKLKASLVVVSMVFDRWKSCLTQLLNDFEELPNILKNYSNAFVLYLDFSKAFDKVDHVILLQN